MEAGYLGVGAMGQPMAHSRPSFFYSGKVFPERNKFDNERVLAKLFGHQAEARQGWVERPVSTLVGMPALGVTLAVHRQIGPIPCNRCHASQEIMACRADNQAAVAADSRAVGGNQPAMVACIPRLEGSSNFPLAAW